MERVKGIEPSWPAWKAGALPLSYTRLGVGERTMRNLWAGVNIRRVDCEGRMERGRGGFPERGVAGMLRGEHERAFTYRGSSD